MSPLDLSFETLRSAFLNRRNQAVEIPQIGATPSEKIWAAARCSLDRRQTTRLLDRSINEPNLALEWCLARQLQKEMTESEEQRTAAPISYQRNRWAIAAGIVLAVVAGLWVLVPDPQQPVYRQTVATDNELALPQDADLLLSDPVLRWAGPKEAVFKVWVLRSDSLQMVYQASDLATPLVVVPTSSLVDLPPDLELLWWVEAQLPSGQRHRSEAARLFLRQDE